MEPHVHIGIASFFIFGLYMLIFSFFWRVLSTKFADKDIGKAMAFVLG